MQGLSFLNLTSIDSIIDTDYNDFNDTERNEQDEQQDIPSLVDSEASPSDSQELQFASIKSLYNDEIILLSALLNAHDADKRFLEIEERSTGSLCDKYASMDDASRPELVEIIEQLRTRIESSQMMELEFEKQDVSWTLKEIEVKGRTCVLSQVDTDDLEMIGICLC
jgi:hypothetical protein